MTFLGRETLCTNVHKCFKMLEELSIVEFQSATGFSQCSPSTSIPCQLQHHSWVAYPETGSLPKQNAGIGNLQPLRQALFGKANVVVGVKAKFEARVGSHGTRMVVETLLGWRPFKAIHARLEASTLIRMWQRVRRFEFSHHSFPPASQCARMEQTCYKHTQHKGEGMATSALTWPKCEKAQEV